MDTEQKTGNASLAKLKEEAARLSQAKWRLSKLQDQKKELTVRVSALDAERAREQRDVDKLEGRSLAAMFYRMTGKIEERLDKEKMEAYTAEVKYDAAVRDLEAVEQDIAAAEETVSRLKDCEQQYERLLEEKKKAVRGSGTELGKKVLDLEVELGKEREGLREINEAIAAGKQALCEAEKVLKSLSSAEGWGMWDMFGGGAVSSMVKHSHMDEAQAHVEQLQIELRRFRTELADVETPELSVQAGIGGFTRFADVFFDNIFLDWAVQDQIKQSQKQTENTKAEIEGILGRLQQMKEASEAKLQELQGRMDSMIEQA